MHCPVCNSAETKVVDSRMSGDGMNIRRRRECERCGHRFSTLESLEILELAVVKRDGSRQPYSREKLEAGLRRALEKRPITADDFHKLVNLIERDIQKLKRDEVTSKEIGEIVMHRLQQFDKIAYIRFASVYRSFEDVKTFERELKRLMAPARPERKSKGKGRAAKKKRPYAR
ncbi:MAG: transcriptional regulator NrdR [Patescibacteria group bacterium]